MSKIALNIGIYKLVCTCGLSSIPIRINKPEQVENYCFRCEGEGKFIKMETKDLRFYFNGNNKLNCPYFSTLQLRDDKVFSIGAKFNVFLNDIPKGQVQIIQINYFTLDKINEFVARLESGFSPEECRKYILRQHKNKPTIDWFTQQLAFCLCEYLPKKQNLF